MKRPGSPRLRPRAHLSSRDALEMVIGLVLIAVAVVVVTQSLPEYESAHRTDALGPGFFPFWIAVIVMALGLFLIAGNLLRPEQPDGQSGVRQPEEGPTADRLHLLVTVLIAGAYVALIPLLGFGVASFLFTVSYMQLERAPWLQTLGVALGCVALGLIARHYAFIQLPVGVVGF